MTVKIAIVDVMGLSYDPTTLENYGLGGSESAIIYMARELKNQGLVVTVFNNCTDSRAKEGIYDGVEYIDIRQLQNNQNYSCDILISSRTILPFLPEDFRYPGHMNRYQCLRKSAKLKVLWLHDTFCSGDEFVEELLVKNYIDELFTLSDFHTSYITNCLHQKRRNFEVLKNRVFVTRNGARKYIDSVDVNAKDKNLFIYNASISKGLMPLVNKIWPKLKQLLPDIKLRVIGGFYRFHDGAEPDEQEKQWRELSQRDDLRNLDVEFTGLIPQKEIAQHLASARFMIFPGAFPETFGISSLESMLYNTPVITNRFGALEEVAIDNACYKVDYAIQPNGLFPEINEDGQVEKFVETVLHAYRNDYLYLQKSQFCNIVHDVAGWGGIALQWKQHFYRKLNLYLPVEDYRAVTKLNRRIHEVYGRRFSNTEEWNEYSHGPQQHISIISPFYNAKQYLKDCILSTATQDYENFTHYLIDDASTDGSFDVAQDIIHSLPSQIQKKYKLIRNGKNVGAVCNQVLNILPLPDDDIIMMLDGDDSLINRNDLFHKYNNTYDGSVEFTYGSMMSMADNIPLIAQPYPDYVRQAKSYRTHIFAWGIPYTHLRTFRKHLINNVEISKFRHENGEWFRAGGDNATFYNIIEQADPNKIRAITDVVYRYNDVNPLNDYKVNREEQNKTSNSIRKMSDIPYVVKNEYIDNVGPWFWSDDSDLSWRYIKEDWFPLKNAILKHMSNFDVCVQAGGHQGMYPRLFHNHFKKVYTFEADSTNFYYLQKNCPQADIIKTNAAVGAYDRKISLRKWNNENTGCFIPENNDTGDIPVVTIDSLNLEKCDLIQLDVERYEMYALMGAIKTIEKFKPLIVCEGPETTNDVCTHILEQLGYEIVDIVGSCNDTVYKFTNRPPPSRTQPLVEKKHIPLEKKKVLLAIPTNKYIEPETFKSIYDLKIPENVEVSFQYFYGYQIDQIRNLIAQWAEKYDYLFSVDSDIVLPEDTLIKLMAHNVDMVSGVYIQRKPNQEILEIYRYNSHGGMSNISMQDISPAGLHKIDGCGFGCVLVKSEVIRKISYPQFVYHSALNHQHTISEDIHFCREAAKHGASIYVDSTIICDHIGSAIYRPK